MGIDNRIIVILFTTAAVLLAPVIGVAVGSGDIILPAFFLMLLCGVLVIAKPSMAVFLAVALSASGLTLPGLPGNLDLFLVCSLALLGCTLLATVYQKAIPVRITFPHWMLIFFTGIVFMTGFLRGFGFQSLGSGLWGGLFYVQVLLGGTLVFTLPRINMAPHLWRPAIFLMSILAILPTLATLFLIWGLPYQVFGLFLKLGSGFEQLYAETLQGGQGIGRLNSAGFAAQTMLIGFLAIVPTRKLFHIRGALWWLWLLAIIAISLLSGARLLTVMLPCTVFVAVLLQRSLTIPRVILGVLISILGIITVYYTIDSLPYSVQRTLSWLPGLKVSNAVAQDAAGTVDWRLDLWHVAIRYIPEYFWLGKGFSYDGRLLAVSQMRGVGGDPLDWAMIMGWYHHGCLSLLLLLGIGGLITGICMMIFSVWNHFRLNSATWNSPTLHLCHQAVLASQIVGTSIFLIIAGDVQEYMARFLLQWAILDSLRVCDGKLRAVELDEEIMEDESHYAPVSE